MFTGTVTIVIATFTGTCTVTIVTVTFTGTFTIVVTAMFTSTSSIYNSYFP